MSHGVDISPQKIVDEYFEVLKRKLARPSKSLRIADEEDVAIEAIERFLRLARQGAFGSIDSQEHLSGLIFLIARRRLNEMLIYEMAQKRGGKDKIVFLDQTGLQVTADNCNRAERGINAKAVVERVSAELDIRLSEILQLWMQGKDSQLIAAEIGVTQRTVQYRLAEIRKRLPRFVPEFA